MKKSGLLFFICCKFFTVLTVTSSLFANTFQLNHPTNGGIFRQPANGFSWILITHRPVTKEGAETQVEISRHADFSKITYTNRAKSHRHNWKTRETGKFFVRMHRVDSDGKQVVTTSPRFFIIQPAAPSFTDQQGFMLQNIDGKPNLSLAWKGAKKVKGLSFFRIKIASDAAFDKPVLIAEQSDMEFKTDKIAPGCYYVKIGAKYRPEIPIVYSQVKIFALPSAIDDDTKQLLPFLSDCPKPVLAETPPSAVASPLPPAYALTPVKPIAAETFDYDSRLPTIKIGWNVVPTPKEKIIFELKIAGDSEFNVIVKNNKIETDSVIFNDLPSGVYYWQVTASSLKNDFIAATAVQSFHVVQKTVEVPSPQLREPQDKLAIETYGNSQRVQVTLGKVAEAAAYVLEVATDESFEDKETINILHESHIINRQVGAYFIRAKALDGEGVESGYSKVSQFSIFKSKSAIDLNAPSDNELFKKFKIEFAWDSFPECPLYELAISQDRNFSGNFIKKTTEENSIEVELDETDSYYYYVSCKLGSGKIVKSQERTFSILTED